MQCLWRLVRWCQFMAELLLSEGDLGFELGLGRIGMVNTRLRVQETTFVWNELARVKNRTCSA